MRDDGTSGGRGPASAEGSAGGTGTFGASRRATDPGAATDADRGAAAERSADPGRATPADAPDLPGQTTMLPVGDADLPETGVGVVGAGAGGAEEDVTSPATPTNEQLEPSGFDTASSDASPDLTR